ncbi:hypothetical protein LINPERPRIM_LOCUS21367 [Linum perenne]
MRSRLHIRTILLLRTGSHQIRRNPQGVRSKQHLQAVAPSPSLPPLRRSRHHHFRGTSQAP